MKKKSRNTFFFLLLILHHIIALPMSLRRVIHPEYAWILHLCFSLSLHSLAPVCARVFSYINNMTSDESGGVRGGSFFQGGGRIKEWEWEHEKYGILYFVWMWKSARVQQSEDRTYINRATVSAISSGDERVKVKAYIRDRERGGQQRARARAHNF